MNCRFCDQYSAPSASRCGFCDNLLDARQDATADGRPNYEAQFPDGWSPTSKRAADLPLPSASTASLWDRLRPALPAIVITALLMLWMMARNC